ncbi:hypothetical protein Cni_G13265 [Canna indica]|uniref:Phytocyanin domain-containing protein n=1 Tax=Canna indica TaxID=4628 RepID=A0AAQ3QBC7_9LILI|nr:hypothetical protein Cni_G13265 [Canna indica]
MAVLRALVAAVAVAAIFELAMGVNYDVGGPAGSWDLSTNYAQWVAGKKFNVNDTLTFKYTSAHDVLEVNSAAYAACDGSKPITKETTGMTIFTLPAAGKKYFICGVGNHCAQGMKVEVDVSAASSPPSPPSVSPTSPPPSSGPAAAPPPPSGAAGSLGKQANVALGFGLGMVLMVVGL